MPSNPPVNLTAVLESPSIRMATVPNAGPKTLDGTHTYIIGRDPAYIVDPGPSLTRHLDSLLDAITLDGITLRAVLLTHGHPDHAPGAVHVADRLHLPIYASHRVNANDLDDASRLRPFPGDFTLPVEGDMIEVIDSPGHSHDHVAFWLPGARVLLAGDTVLGRGSTLVQPPEGDMTDYMRTLEMFVTLKPRLLLPGHGPIVTDPTSKLQEYVEHRVRRENELVMALAGGAASAAELVDRLYADVSPDLRALALGSVNGTLEKLIREGRVIGAGDLFRLP